MNRINYSFLGRAFTEESKVFGSARECVISHRLWRSRLGGRENVVGQALTLNGERLVIAGVTPEGFYGSSPATSSSDIWVPITAHTSFAPELRDLRNPRTRNLILLGRLAPTMTRQAAELAMDATLRRSRVSQIGTAVQTNEKLAILLPGGNRFPVRREDLPKAIGFPLVLAGLVLLMACGNVSHLILARLMGRQRELAVRVSLGASGLQILRTCLAETAILALTGAVGGLALAIWFLSFVQWLSRFMPGYVHLEAQLDWASLVSAVAFGATVSVAAGLLPAIRAIGLDPHHSLKSRGASSSARGWFNFQNAVVFQQVVTSMVLLLLTGFVVLGWYRAAGRDLGYDARGAYLIKLDPVRSGLTLDESGPLIQRIAQRLRTEPWIRSTSIAYSIPVAMSSGDMMVAAKVDFAEGAKALPTARINYVGEGFFRNLGVRLVQGREFTASDERPSSRVVVVNQTLANRTWPGGQAVGQTLRLDNEAWEVVGVANDIKSAFLLSPDLPVIYQPIHAKMLPAASRHGVVLFIRTSLQSDVAGQVERLLESMDTSIQGVEVTALDAEIELAAFFTRFALFVYGGMGLFGLILACVGLAGVTAQAVVRRTPEIGIRTALGATRSDILRLIVGHSAGIVVVGAGAGMLAALGMMRVLGAFVESFSEIAGFSTSDPAILIGAPLLLAGVSLLAAGLPALRVLRIEASSALRVD